MKIRPGSLVFLLILLAVVIGLAVAVAARLNEAEDQSAVVERRPAPVEVAEVGRGPIEQRRTFSGTLEATAEFSLAPKVSGRVEWLAVDLADAVQRGQVVAELDDAEFRAAVAEAEAERAVARANLAEARSALEIAQREFDRITALRERGVASDSQYDTASAEFLSSQAAVQAAEAQLQSAQASLEAAEIRLGFTIVKAEWREGDAQRVVAERYVDEGDTISANSPILTIVELNPVKATFQVTERDYGLLRVGQPVLLMTDAYPGEAFEAEITRIAPVFRPESRQAIVEVLAANDDLRLKPGMFVRAEVVLSQVDNALLIPAEAIVRRNDRESVFLVDDDGRTVSLVPVEIGIRERDHVQVLSPEISGRVVTLGQQLLDDGSAISIPEPTGAEQP